MTDVTPSSGETPRSLRDSLIAQHGFAIGEAMYEIQLAARRKAADHVRDLQTQLSGINAQIDAHMRESERALIPFTKQMEKSYEAWMRDCQARDGQMLRDQSSLTELRNEAAALIREINQPDAHFLNRVKNWGQPA